MKCFLGIIRSFFVNAAKHFRAATRPYNPCELTEETVQAATVILFVSIFALLFSCNFQSYQAQLVATAVNSDVSTPAEIVGTIPVNDFDAKSLEKSDPKSPKSTKSASNTAPGSLGRVIIPSVGINIPVATPRAASHVLAVPASGAKSYYQYGVSSKILIIGHVSTTFRNLKNVTQGTTIYYNGHTYRVVSSTKYTKSAAEDQMSNFLAATSRQTIVIMTCEGTLYGSDASHRRIVTAVAE